MGFYIESPDGYGHAKLLAQHGAEQLPAAQYVNDPDWITVCIVDNGPFQACAVIHDEVQFNMASQVEDTREKIWFRVPRKAVVELCPLAASSLEPKESGPAPWYRNYYRCSVCRTAWEDEWDCTCNDRCPRCNAEIEPIRSERLE